MRWHEILRHADDCSATYSDGIARVGRSVYIRVLGITTRSDHTSEPEAQEAYIEACSILSI